MKIIKKKSGNVVAILLVSCVCASLIIGGTIGLIALTVSLGKKGSSSRLSPENHIFISRKKKSRNYRKKRTFQTFSSVKKQKRYSFQRKPIRSAYRNKKKPQKTRNIYIFRLEQKKPQKSSLS